LQMGAQWAHPVPRRGTEGNRGDGDRGAAGQCGHRHAQGQRLRPGGHAPGDRRHRPLARIRCAGVDDGRSGGGLRVRASAATVGALSSRLASMLPAGTLRAEQEVLERYATDASDGGTHLPQLVALPQDTAQVSRILKEAHAAGVPVTPCGARTGKSGGSLPVEGGAARSLERMNRIVEIDPVDLVAVVEPGVVLGDLMEAVEAKGLFYPPDPNSWPSCTLGGNVAENAGGPRAL